MPSHCNGQPNIRLRAMTEVDIPLGLRLTSLAGWNQTPSDWRMLLDAGFGLVATCGDTAVGTATVVPYGTAFSWIGMVLVDPAYRRRGVGTALLERAIAEARPYGCVRLDATPQGKPLYARLGFRAEYGLVRMVRHPQSLSATATPLSSDILDNAVCRHLGSTPVADLTAYDTPSFGAHRHGILEAFACNAPHYAFTYQRGGAIRGYCLGRSGATHEQIGPVIADSVEIAQTLLLQALRACRKRSVIVDVPSDRGGWVAYLRRMGFVAQRPFTRMVLGTDCPAGEPERQYAIAGPEIG